MILAELKRKVQEAIARDKTKEALDTLQAELKTDSDFYNSLFILQAELSRTKTDRRNGVMSQSDESVIRNQLHSRIQSFLEDITSDMLRNGADADLNPPKGLSAAERQGIQRTIDVQIKIINRLRETLALETDPIRQVRYEEQLQQAETKLADLKRKL